MKSISHNLRKKLFITSLFLVMFTSFATAQDNDGEPIDEWEEGPDVNDEPAAPIDEYLFAGMIVGSFLAIRKLKKSELV